MLLGLYGNYKTDKGNRDSQDLGSERNTVLNSVLQKSVADWITVHQ